jgi:hypothetical protein
MEELEGRSETGICKATDECGAQELLVYKMRKPHKKGKI